MRVGTAYNARSYLFLRVHFYLKNSKKKFSDKHRSVQTPSELLARPPAGWRIIFNCVSEVRAKNEKKIEQKVQNFN